MRLVIQRVSRASVSIGGEIHSAIGRGLMVLVGIADGDTEDDVRWLAAKTAAMRIFPDADGVMNRSLLDTGGDVLAVSQFTLNASTRKGNRPSYIRAADHDLAIPLYELYCKLMSEATGKTVATGVFGADMQVELINDGPVTIIIDSRLRE
ncbi:MAG: D-tyrosyl-tRNA(Tyr) deacylase [Muribaculaceae bacterium]|nr:D-tyrosyl-tRNA(Tyr) deacylase [Muribaculaceae bacterium]